MRPWPVIFLRIRIRIGRRIGIGSDKPDREIIGVIKDTKYSSLKEQVPRTVYVPLAQSSMPIGERTLHVRTAGDPTALIGALRHEVRNLDSELPVYNVKTFSELVAATLSQERLIATLSSFFGILAMLLAAIGLYGVMAYTVASRTREIGVRMALGARRRDVMALVLGQGITLVLIGAALGLVAAVAITRSLSGLLYGVSTTDPVTFLLTALYWLSWRWWPVIYRRGGQRKWIRWLRFVMNERGFHPRILGFRRAPTGSPHCWFAIIYEDENRSTESREERRLWDIIQDIRYGVRTLLKKPAFLFVAVLTLALGIGANTAIFTAVNSILLRPLPFVDSQSLVMIYGGSARSAIVDGTHSYPDFFDYKNQSQTLSHVIAYDSSGSIITGADGETEQIYGSDISAETFEMLGVKPMLGRLFTMDEDQPGGPSIILLSHGLWKRRFNADNNIVGKDVRFGVTGRAITVIGVMPEGFKFPVDAERSDYWMPFTNESARYYDNSLPGRDSRGIPLLGKLKPGVSIQQAQAEMEAITSQLETQYPQSNTGRRVRLVPLQEEITGNIRPALLMLLFAVGFVLLIACANIANLTLARATVRSKEMAIRAALGASRRRIIRQLLTESVLVALVGGLFGLLLALWGVDIFKAVAPADIPRVSEISLDYRVLFFALSLSLLTGLICGLAPALQASKTDLNEALKEGGKGTGEGSRRNRLRGLLIVSEVALSLVLLISAGLLLRSFVRLLNNPTGYTAAGVLTVDVPLSRTQVSEARTAKRVLRAGHRTDEVACGG